jgi:iron complex outermembrane receptor protein
MLSAAVCLMGSAAFAQTTEPVKPGSATASAKAGEIETIVVTAEKRAENSQRVPIALTAIQGGDLDQQGIKSFQDLTERVPDLRFGSGVTGGENVITIRGIGSQNTTPGGDAPVAYSVDGVTLQRTTAVDPEFYDINDIEVLEGPQGTLEGRNAVGGAIRVITNHPTDQFSGGLDAAVGNYDSRIFRGWLNAPLVDDNGMEINARITGVSDVNDGYVTNVSKVPGATHNLDATDLSMLRGQVDIKFSPDVDLLLEASTLRNTDPVATKVQFWEAPFRYPGQTFFADPWKVDNDYPDIGKDKLDLYIATLNWNLGWATLTNVAGYEKSYHDSSNDADGSGLPIAYNGDWLEKQQQWSDEIRLASSDANDPLRWVGGFYFFQAENFEHFAFVDTGLNSPPVSPSPACAPFSSPTCESYTFFSHGNLASRAWAPFGQVDYDFGKTSLAIPLTVTLGLRYSDDEKYGDGTLFFDGFPIVAPLSHHTWGQWTGKFGLAYQFTPDVMGYASVSRGYLSGGNIIGLASFYEPEHVWSYEVGEKAQLFDNHLQLNVSAYHENLVNMQVFIQSGPNSVLQNAAAAHVNGVEAQAVWIPLDGLRINLAGALTTGKYDKYLTDDNRFASGPGPGCGPAPLGCNFKGHWLNQTPPYTLNLGVEYDWMTSIGTFVPRIDTFWSGKVYFIPDNLTNQGAYNQTDLSLTWTDPSNRYSLQAFAKNIGNTAVISNDGLQSGSLSGPAGFEVDNYTYYQPRTFGIRFGVKFGG